MKYCGRSVYLIFLLLIALPLAAAPQKDSKLHILILGDSITAGYGVEKEEAFAVLLQKSFHDSGYKNIKVTGNGVSGDTSAAGPGRLRWLMKTKPDVLVLELGGNDGLRGFKIEAIKQNLKKTIQLAKANNMRVILLGISLPANYGKDYNQRFTNLFGEVAKEEKIDFVPFFFDKLSAESLHKIMQKDGIHPNKEGHEGISKELFKELMRIL